MWRNQQSKALWIVWNRMRTVCRNTKDPRYPSYGGRGIKCDWKSFDEFRKDMERSYNRHLTRYGKLNTTIERVDNDGDYSKKNCRWATRKEQAQNRRSRVNVSFDGRIMSVTEWAEYMKLPKVALWHRLYRSHWPVEKALTTPIRRNH